MEEVVSLKEYFLSKFEAQEQAITLARVSMEKRLEGMNEFRDQLRDQASRFVTGKELSALLDKINQDLEELKEVKNINEGKASVTAVYVAWGIGFVGLILGAASLLVTFY